MLQAYVGMLYEYVLAKWASQVNVSHNVVLDLEMVMSRMTYVEVTCNGCGCADFYLYPTTNKQIEDAGYLVEGRKHFCNQECKDAHDARPKPDICCDV